MFSAYVGYYGYDAAEKLALGKYLVNENGSGSQKFRVGILTGFFGQNWSKLKLDEIGKCYTSLESSAQTLLFSTQKE